MKIQSIASHHLSYLRLVLIKQTTTSASSDLHPTSATTAPLSPSSSLGQQRAVSREATISLACSFSCPQIVLCHWKDTVIANLCCLGSSFLYCLKKKLLIPATKMKRLSLTNPWRNCEMVFFNKINCHIPSAYFLLEPNIIGS